MVLRGGAFVRYLGHEGGALIKGISVLIAKTWKQTKCPSTDEQIKMWYIFTMEYCSAIKKNKIMLFETIWMDLEITILSEVSHTERDKYHMIALTCGS